MSIHYRPQKERHIKAHLDMSYSQINAFLEEKLNDIDEFIQSELGFEPLRASGVNGLNTFAHSRELVSDPTNNPGKQGLGTASTNCHESPNKVSEVELEVQIMNLKDVYDKKTRRTLEGLEYRLEDSEVTIMLKATDVITGVRAYVQRCPEAAIRTHDTLGPVELDVNTLQKEARRRVATVDLGSVYKTEGGDPVYWLEKADVMQRNKWELIIAMEFSSGLTGEVTSKPFRVTTKAGYKIKGIGECFTGCYKMQRLVRKITASTNHFGTDQYDWERFRSLSSCGIKKERRDDASAMCEEFKEFNLLSKDDSVTQRLSGYNFNWKCAPLAETKILLQPDTVLDKHMVTKYYNRVESIHRAVEQAELPGLLKLFGKNSKLVCSRRKANGHKSSDEDFWWACGRCFFERRKKSTIKAHIIQRVCQKSIETKKSRGKGFKCKVQRHLSYDFEDERFENYSWKQSLSV